MVATQWGEAGGYATGQRMLGAGSRCREQLPDRNLPTSARLSPDLGAAGGSRSILSAWILRKRSLRSVFCARAWNMLRIAGLY